MAHKHSQSLRGASSVRTLKHNMGLRLKAQYFLAYAVEGSVGPYLAVFFAQDQGLTAAQIGAVMAAASIAVFITPVALSALADTRLRETRLLAGTLFVSAMLLLLLFDSSGYVQTLVVFALFSLAYEPTKPLQDGLFFTAQRFGHLPGVPFHRVRVWGTLGYMVPGGLAYLLLTGDRSVGLVLLLACGLATMSAVNSGLLPHPGQSHRTETNRSEGPSALRTTVGQMWGSLGAAGRILRRRRVLLFMAAMGLLQSAHTAYRTFYPLYVTDSVGIPPEWLGLIANVGVALEIGYMTAFGWFTQRLGWRRFMLLGCGAQAGRLAVLAAFPTVAAAVGTQVVHGLVVIVTVVASRIFLDEEADDATRHTIQGLFTMLVVGGSRIVGSLGAGAIASVGLSWMFAVASAASVVACGLFVLAFPRGATGGRG